MLAGNGLLRTVGQQLAALVVAGAVTPAAAQLFTEEAAARGLDFVHFNGMSGEFYTVENIGQGGALIDYDNDGDLDIYLVQGAMLGPGKTIADASVPPRHPLPLTDRLYRNDSMPEGGPRWVDVTSTAGLRPAPGYGMGVAAGDIDDDGWVDLYRTAFGPNQLLRNRGDGTFDEITSAAGVDDPRWSVAASFLDVDLDGRLDLFVANYMEFSFGLHVPCPTATGAPNYCSPLTYRPQSDRLFRNRGGGVFEDITVAAGIESEYGRALGAASADFDGDGRMDLYVANDQSENQLWINRGGRFVNEALLAGSAVNWQGDTEASMGVDAGDFDNDGDEDLILGHLVSESNTLFRNQGALTFLDVTPGSGLATPSWPHTTFGALWLDYDNDGLLDLLTVNGAVAVREALVRANDPYPLHEPNQLYRGLGDGKFEDRTAEAGEAFTLSEVSRGAADGDLDNDGDADLLVTNNSGPVRLLLNRQGSRASWLGLRLLGGPGARDWLGSRVEIRTAGGGRVMRRAHADGSYASAVDPRVLAGLGEATRAQRVRLSWLGGGVQEWRDLPVRRYLVVRYRGGDR